MSYFDDKEYNRIWRKEHPDYQKIWRKEHPDYQKKKKQLVQVRKRKDNNRNGGWGNKMEVCSICKELFIVRKHAKTTDTRTLCFKCRRAVRETTEELKK